MSLSFTDIQLAPNEPCDLALYTLNHVSKPLHMQ